MPDTYISQFSGEEIDSALRAAQIISGADTPAELRKKLEIRGDTIPVSATDPTPVSEALTASGGGVNPNLLDSWYFGNPVNQRKGYYIPAGVKYNDLSWNPAGTTDKAYPVVGYSGQDPLITIDGTNYIVGKSAQVPGYCTIGYTIDRWRIGDGSNGTLSLTESGLKLTRTDGVMYLAHRIPKTQIPEGNTLTYSALTTLGLYSISFVVKNDTYHEQDVGGGISLGWNYTPAEMMELTLVNNTVNSDVTVRAVKLELGSTQTLAHKEGDKWILNEIPDYGEQLRRCTYYAEKVESKDTPAITNSTFVPSGATSAVFILPYARKRTVPAINFNDVSNYRIIARSISGGTTAFSVTAISLLDIGRTKAAILVSFNTTDQGYYCFLQRSDNAPAGYAFISADL